MSNPAENLAVVLPTEPMVEPSRSYTQSAIEAAPPVVALEWTDGEARLRALADDEARTNIAEDPSRFLAIADAGVWFGRDDQPTYCRSFVALCGRTLVMCDFVNAAPLGPADAFDVPDRAEWQAIHAVLAGLAGPQHLDVQVVRVLRSPVPLAADDTDRTVWIFLPDMHLPLVPPMPDLPSELVPDPTRATCFCHGPVMARILGRSAATPATYSAVGTAIGRDPNEWFYLMAEHYRAVADDLVKFLSRFQKVAQRTHAHLVQMGGLFEIWAGFDVTFAATGRAGQVLPRILRGAHVQSFADTWRDRLRDTANRRAIVQMSRLPSSMRTLLQDDPEFFARDVPLIRGAVERPWLRVGSLFHAEHHPRGLPLHRDAPPIGFVALMEQNARFLPWQRNLPDEFRTLMVAWWVEALIANETESLPGASVMAHSHVPFLANVRW